MDWSPTQVETRFVEVSELRMRDYQMSLTVFMKQDATDQMT
jgi:hypothetical protein